MCSYIWIAGQKFMMSWKNIKKELQNLWVKYKYLLVYEG